MKKQVTLLMFLLLSAMTVCFCSLPALAQSDSAQNTSSEPEQTAETVAVMGRGKIVVAADCAELCFGIETKAETLAESQRKNAEIFGRVSATLSSFGITGDAVANDYSAAYPVCEEGETSFQVMRNLRVKLTELGRVDELSNALTEAGVTHFNGVRYSLEDTAEPFRKALAAARADALDKVTALEQNLNLSELREMGVYSYSAPNAAGKITVEATVQATFVA